MFRNLDDRDNDDDPKVCVDQVLKHFYLTDIFVLNAQKHVEFQIRELTDTAGCLVTIVTGDSLLTACHVAKEIGVTGKTVRPRGPSSTGKARNNKKDTDEDRKEEGRVSLLLTRSEGSVSFCLYLDLFFAVACRAISRALRYVGTCFFTYIYIYCSFFVLFSKNRFFSLVVGCFYCSSILYL